jgi:hypothetical protein
MHTALLAEGPAADRPAAALALYGRFVGSWEGRVVVHLPDGGRRESPAEAHFAWVLEGRAIQDVWIAPARAGRGDTASRMYGTTLRVFDPVASHWRITWIDPVQNREERMIGRAVGDDIVQETSDGAVRTEWRFTAIKGVDATRPDSFHWIARQAPVASDPAAWTTVAEFFFRRAAGR